MDFGIEVTCGKCTQKFQLWEDINRHENRLIVGMCPRCNNMVGAKMTGSEYSFGNEIVYPTPDSYKGLDWNKIQEIPYHE